MASLHQLPPELHLAAHAAVLPGVTGLEVAECQCGKVDLMARVLQLTGRLRRRRLMSTRQHS